MELTGTLLNAEIHEQGTVAVDSLGPDSTWPVRRKMIHRDFGIRRCRFFKNTPLLYEFFSSDQVIPGYRFKNL